MLATLLTLVIGLAVILIAWRLLRAVLVVGLLVVALALGVGAVHHLHLGRVHVPGVRVATISHTVRSDMHSLTHAIDAR